MIKSKAVIQNKLGLHARASAKFILTTSKFQSQINVAKGNQVVNGKSIMGVMTLSANKGTELLLHIEGPDEEDMEKAVLELINGFFGEEE